jgi:DNA polymerase-3 subunit alpha
MALKIIRTPRTYNLHVHSKFSVGDALPTVKEIVTTTKNMNQVAIGLTDHGNMGGAVQLYKEATKVGMLPFPGTELYVVNDRADLRAKRHHMCVVAYTTQGYRNLVKMNTMANQNMHHKPLIDFSDMAGMSESGLLEGIAATSGCYFGFIAQAVSRGDDAEARRLMKLMDKWFPKFYVELQNHNITHDEETGVNDNILAGALHNIANELGIPCVLTQDAHYAHPEDKINHETMKRLVAWGDDPDDAVFPGDGFHLADDSWFRDHHDDKRFASGVEGLDDLIASHDLHIDELDNYHYRIPFTVADPDKALKLRCNNALNDMKLEKRYLDRLSDELAIVTETGQAGYLLLIAAIADWLHENEVFFQARGSASGSVICWLLGITQVDPIKYGLGFSRFISRDRTKPADIDLDIERARRDELIEYLKKTYAVSQIGTWAEMGLTGDDDNGKGSLVRKYYTQHNKRNEKKIHDWDDIPDEDKVSLRALAEKAPFSSHGTNAAGVIVATQQTDIDNLVPLMRVGEKKAPRFVSQYDMDDTEALGILKVDVLGLATMDVLHKAMENLGRNIKDGLGWIPLADRSTYSMIARGQTDGIFQLEGGSARRGCRDLKPTKLDDIIASMSLFRPATMNSGATASYIKRKNRDEEQPELPPILRKHTLKTYGTIIYQDQVIDALRDIGMDADNLTAFLKAVKASNADIGNAGKVIREYESMVKGMAAEHGIVDDEWEWFWESISGFAAYSFNLAHSTAYGMTAYRCAYLVNHHPTEYFAALLNEWAGQKKETPYLTAARRRGLKIRRPTVNKSHYSYSVVQEGQIMKGMLSVAGIAEKTAKKIIDSRPEGGFTSIKHFCECVGPTFSGVRNYMKTGETNVGTLGKMMAAGMFDSMEE